MPDSFNLQNTLTLIYVLKEASKELTNLINSIAEILNLDPSLELVISLRNFIEPQVEGTSEGESRERICGYYDPEKKQIVLSYPCLINGAELDLDRLFRTIAHELVHHCQYTCTTN
jgi:hypothetical protein